MSLCCKCFDLNDKGRKFDESTKQSGRFLRQLVSDALDLVGESSTAMNMIFVPTEMKSPCI